RQVRCSRRQLSGIQTGDETAAAYFHAGDRSIYDKESSTKRQGNRRAARALQDSDRSAVGRANFALRSVERSQGRGGGIETGEQGSGCAAGTAGQFRHRRSRR